MQNINRVLITGNLTRDPEIRRTANGMPIMSVGVAVNDSVKNNATGEWEERANYIDCNMFGARAEKVAQYLSKGMKVAVGGKLRYGQWQDKQTGQNRSKVEVTIDEIEFFTAPRSQGAQGQDPHGNGAQDGHGDAYAQVAQAVANAQPVMYAEDIPF